MSDLLLQLAVETKYDRQWTTFSHLSLYTQATDGGGGEES